MSTPNDTSPGILHSRQQFGIGYSSAAEKSSRRSISRLVAWAWSDMLTVVVAGTIAIYLHQTLQVIRIGYTDGAPRQTSYASFIYLVLFSTYLVLCSQFLGLYPQDLKRSGLYEQRMTLQASVIATLLLCGTLYLLHWYVVSRTSVMLTGALSLILLMIRRGSGRWMVKRSYLQGLETRNILIIGDGPTAQALRRHLEALHHRGFRFKGFISMVPQNDMIAHVDVVGDVDNCVAIARSLFVDEIYFATPLDRRTVISVVERARPMGIDVRVVPDFYDGLAWNARLEYIGPFPSIPLTDHKFPDWRFLNKRVYSDAVEHRSKRDRETIGPAQ
jgi:FlaA1/EpsC-like NDP-sugar epimerase